LFDPPRCDEEGASRYKVKDRQIRAEKHDGRKREDEHEPIHPQRAPTSCGHAPPQKQQRYDRQDFDVE
jgi:hypothetical protein